jgi:hypothetical protein
MSFELKDMSGSIWVNDRKERTVIRTAPAP